MSLRERWSVQCDIPECEETLTLPDPRRGEGAWDRWDAGIYITDAGWDAQPRRKQTYCPKHSKIGENDV